jgi:hypothetical protein
MIDEGDIAFLDAKDVAILRLGWVRRGTGELGLPQGDLRSFGRHGAMVEELGVGDVPLEYRSLCGMAGDEFSIYGNHGVTVRCLGSGCVHGPVYTSTISFDRRPVGSLTSSLTLLSIQFCTTAIQSALSAMTLLF